jgi:hypothetical protein
MVMTVMGNMKMLHLSLECKHTAPFKQRKIMFFKEIRTIEPVVGCKYLVKDMPTLQIGYILPISMPVVVVNEYIGDVYYKVKIGHTYHKGTILIVQCKMPMFKIVWDKITVDTVEIFSFVLRYPI